MENPISVGTSCPPCESAPKTANNENKSVNATAFAPAPKPSRPFVYDATDTLFALIFFGVGYCYIYVLTQTSGYFWRGWLLFTAVFITAVLSYGLLRGVKPPKESWFWLTATALVGLSCRLVEIDGSFAILRFYGLTLLAVYWVLCYFGVLTGGKTGNYIAIDMVRGLFVLPFGNFFAGLRCIVQAICSRGKKKHHMDLVIGIILAFALCAGVIIPLLSRADAQFSELLSGFRFHLSSLFFGDFLVLKIRLILALPVSAYLFGLCYGAARRRADGLASAETLQKSEKKIRILPLNTVLVVVAAACALYLLFILLQAGYLFSAFAGVRPAEFTYAEYARRGFFELCQLTCFNLALLWGINTLCRSPRAESRLLKASNLALGTLTLFLIATALSKMLLYVDSYGLTPKRIVTTLFMVGLAIVFVLLLVWQYRSFNLVGVAAVLFTVIFVLLCLVDLREISNAYNAARGFDPIFFDIFYL